MKKRHPVLQSKSSFCGASSIALVGAVLACGVRPASADTTPISTTPIATASNVTAKPNIMFILDNSGSMASEYMPDDMSNSGRYGYYSSQCNGLAYDPSAVYDPPVYVDSATGAVVSYPSASFAAAWNDGYAQGSTLDLSTTGTAGYYSYSGTEPKMGWTYTASSVITSTNFYKQCQSKIGNSPGSAVFTWVPLSGASSGAQNYANWYSYYRTRRLMMRAAAGKAFSALSDQYRVGFTTISDKNVSNGSSWFLNVGDFNTTQKVSFFTSLYSATGSSNTPLRGALSKIGRYYSNKITGQTDPMQYSCQRNYAILSTDGYWNTGSESSSYGPLKLDGSNKVGQQDGGEVRPMKDDAYSQSTETKTWTSTTRKQTSTPTTVTTPWTRYVWTASAATCSSGKYTVGVLKQVRSETKVDTSISVDDYATPYTEIVVTTDGTLTSDTTSAGSISVTHISSSSNSSDTFDNWADSGSVSSSCRSLPSGLSAGSTGYSSSKTNYTAVTSAGTAGSNSGPRSGTPVVTVLSGPTNSVVNSSVADTSNAGASDTLADVAEYFYATDLRDTSQSNCISGSSGNNVCENNLSAGSKQDTASWQHMTTFTIGLGVNGTLAYDRNYLTSPSGDYLRLTQGTLNWPVPADTSSGGSATNVDDLWHAAVNGRGQYFATSNASTLADAITTSLANVTATLGSSSAAATTSLKPVQGENNQVFVASYKTVEWTGDVAAYPLNATDGSVNTSAATWSAQAQLDQQAAATRNIYYFKSGVSSLRSFTYSNLSSDGYGGYFSGFCGYSPKPAQCSSLSSAQQTLASGSALVDYLKGDQTYEKDRNTSNPLYRNRVHKLGDIVNGAPAYVKKPPFSYTDAGYSAFASSHSSRKPMVYVAANDGMLHAFSADIVTDQDAGTELWAFVPSMVMPNLYRLADTAYGGSHQYSVDGAPVVGDIDSSGAGTGWKTILVGGLNAGGKGYYALDITDPASPKPLWEFKDANLGLSYGNPIITKLKNGVWVVVLTSGYNNTGGDGRGHLFVLNASTGVVLRDISTSAGSSGSPSGLAKINAWVDSESNNYSLRFYGGDLQGNLWRFDVDDIISPAGNEATLLAQFQVNSKPQPITIAPQPAAVTYNNATYPVVFVGTGRYLHSNDVEDEQQQSLYAVKDNLSASGWGDVRANPLMLSRTVTASGSKATISGGSTVDWSSKIGWRIDLPNKKERVVVDMVIQYATLAVASAIPGESVCTPSGGSSWLYQFDFANGTAASSDGTAGQLMGNFLTVGLTWIETSKGSSTIEAVGSDASITQRTGMGGASSGGAVHRTSWRELVN